MTVLQAITHLHSEHKYPLLTCLCGNKNHDHSNLELVPTLVPGRTVLYQDDLAKLKQHPNGHRFFNSDVCLVESSRRSPARVSSVSQLGTFLNSLV